MPATIAQARDQMNALLKAACEVSSTPATGLVLIWDDVEKQPGDADPQVPWARVKIKHSTGGQSSLAGATGLKRYTRGGFIIVQVFTPGGAGLVSHDGIVAIILAAYEGKTTSGGLVFRNGRFQEIGQSGAWHQTNVFIDFEYDEIK